MAGLLIDFLKMIKNDTDIFLSVADLNIKYCGGCNACAKNKNYKSKLPIKKH